MDRAIRQQIIQILTQRIQGENQRGYCPLSLVPKLLRDGGITTEDYFGGSKPKLKVWLEKEFKGRFLILGPPTGEIVVLHSELTHLLTEGRGKYPGLRKEGWSMLLPKVGELLIAGGVAYTKPLRDWFLDNCPCFAADNDRLVLASTVPAPSPADPAGASMGSSVEIKQLYRYLFMNWNSCTERLRELLGQDPPLDFKYVIARQFGLALLGKPGILLDAREDTPPRMALNSGLSTPDGSPVYCVLERNQLAEGELRQSWKLADYCCPGEESDNGLGVWLKSRFSLYKPEETVDLSGVTHQLHTLSEMRETLLPALERYVQELDTQNAPSAELAGQIAEYEGAWRALRENWSKTRILGPMEGKDLSELKDMTDAGLSFTRSLNSILDIFDRLAEAAEQVFSDKKIAPPYTPGADAKLLHERYDNAKEDVSLDLLEETLDHYEDLACILACKNLSDDASRYIQRAILHFSEISLRMAVFFLDCPEDSERLSEKLREARKLLSVCQAQQRELLSSQAAPPPAPAPDKLLELLLSDSADWHYRWPEFACSALPGEPLTQALALNRLGDAEKLLAQAGSNAPCVLPELPAEQTYFGAAQRLMQTVGNPGRAAESYLLLGAFFDSERCVPALLELYRQERRTEDFARLAEKFAPSLPLPLEDQRFYLSFLCKSAPEQAFSYAQEHFALFYDPDCLQCLLPLAGQYAPEEEALLRARLSQLEALPEPDAFTQAVTEMDLAAIQDFINHPERLSGAGYSEAEISRLGVAFTDGEYPSGTDVFSTARRLNRFFGNRGRLAERFLWMALANGSSAQTEVYSLLLTFMADEGRWEECRKFYARYESPISNIPGEQGYLCRGMYLLSLITVSRPEAPKQILSDLVSALYLLADVRPSVQGTIARYAIEDGAADAPFWKALLEEVLPPIVSHSVVHTVALLDHFLERTMLQEDALVQGGVSPQQAKKARELYQKKDFCRDPSAGGTALRVFQFLGDSWDVAGNLARFALRPEGGAPDSGAVQTLWGLAEENQAARFELLVKYPMLQTSHPDAYLAYLFHKEAYQEFLNHYTSESSTDPLDVVRRFIALQNVEPDSRAPLPEELSTLDWVGPLGRRLFEALAKSGRREDLERLLCENFDTWLVTLPPELLKTLVQTAALDREGLRARAAACGQEALAVYCSNILNVQDSDNLCENYYMRVFTKLAGSVQESAGLLQALARLYPQREEEIRDQIIPQRIRVLTEEGRTEEAATAIREQVTSKPVLQQVFTSLKDAALCREEPLCTALSDAAATLDARRDCLYFFHRLSGGKPSRDFLCFLFRLYLQALDRDAFPEELTAEAEKLCQDNVGVIRSNDVLLCLARLSGLSGRREEQAYALACLSLRVTEPEQREQIPELSDDRPQVNIAELFRQVLRQRDPEGILRFFDFCEALAGLVQPSGDPGEEDTASLQKLFADPGNDQLWLTCKEKILPTETAGIVEKFLSLACRKAPKLYDSYMTHCLQNRLYAPLLPVLLRWAGSNSSDNCLTRLSRELDLKPDLFRALTEDAALTQDARSQRQKELPELVELLCEAGAPPEKRTAKRLGELIHVAVKAGSESALSLFLDRFSHTLLEWNGEELFLVLICRLLLDGRFREASLQLQKLSGCPSGDCPYLAQKLCALSGEEELKQWTDDACHRLLLTLPLPDGTRYDGPEKINALILEAVPAGLGLRLARELQALFSPTEPSDDYGLCAAQFILAASAPYTVDPQAESARVSILYHSLHSLVSSDLKSESKSFYRRDRADNAQALALLGAAMESDQTEEITDLCRNVFGNDAYGTLVLKQVGGLLKLRDHFANQNSDTKSLLYLTYLGLVTGNWQGLLELGWKLKASLQTLSIPILKKAPAPGSADPEEQKPAKLRPVSPFGFFRSALQVISTLEADRKSFLDWLESNLPVQLCSPETLKLLREFSQEHLERLIETMGAQPVAELLSCPIEYPTLSRAIFQDKLLPLIKQYPGCRYELALLAGACADHDNLISSLEKRAIRSFTLCEREDFLAASQIYHALEQLCPLGRRHRLYNSNGTEVPPPSGDTRYYPSLYHARYLLCGALGGDRSVLSSICRDDFPLHACINLFLELSLVLSNSKFRLTAETCHGLLGSLTGENREIARALLLFKNSEASDEEKVKFLNEEGRFSDPAWLYLCFLLKYPYGRKTNQGLDERCLSLNHRETAADLNEQYIARCNRHYIPADFLLYVDFRPSKKWDSLYRECESLLSAQLPETAAEETAGSHPADSLSVEEKAPDIPDYARDLEPLDETLDLEAEYQNYRNKWIVGPAARRLWGEDSLAQRLSDSERLCRAAVSDDVSSGEAKSRLSRCLLFYGVDLYNCRQKEEDRAEQLKLFKGFMSLPLSTLISSDCRGTVQSVLTGGAVQNLFAAPDSIDALLTDFNVHRIAYQNIADMSLGSQEQHFEGLYSVLDTLALALSQAANDNARKSALTKALETLPKANGSPWWNVAPAVRPLIREKINLLNDRPDLEISVLNPQELPYPCKGVLSGLVTNYGARPAEEIVLTLRCNGEQSRREYKLSLIRKDAAAAFELPYTVPEQEKELSWEIEVSYHYGEIAYDGVLSGTLRLSGSARELSSRYAGVPFYNTDTISSFQIVDGEPTNPGFIGRETEKNMLKGLFSEPAFSGYGNAILYGIRRAGKTSLLNYAQEYIEANHPEILLVSADCRKLAVGEPVIWKAFVKSCLEKAKMLPRVGGSEELRALEEDWSVPAPTQLQPNPDVSIDELGYFFDRLSAITGMGCYLFLDEMDNLFQILESNHSLDKLITTLQSLSNDHKKSFHFVLCGSTWFLRQLSEGPNTRQLLHHVTQIEVGRLTKPETEELLRTAEKRELPLKITKEAADAVWNFTGGLAWFIKLAGNKAVERATSGNRTILYPYDILEVLGKLVNETNCEVLHDGVDEHDGAFDVLLALQAVTPDQSTYIPENDLRELSGLDKPAFYTAMELLAKLKLIERENTDPPRWHFTLDIYRRYFRKYAKGRFVSDKQVEDTKVLFKKRL